jgi:hypothetical protein
MSKFYRTLTSVALAAGLVAASSAASATTTATIAFDTSLLNLLSAFSVSFGAAGTATYNNGTFSSPAADLASGDTKVTFDANAGLTFTVAGNASQLTFNALEFDSSKSQVLADLHFVNGALKYDYTDVTVFNVGTLSAPLSTLTGGGSVSASVSLSKAGLSNIAVALGIPAPSSDLAAGTLTITSSVPESSTWAMTVAGLLGVAAVARRRQQQG